MSFRYNSIQRISKGFYRKIFPIQKSSYTTGEVEDICSINLVPPKDLKVFFERCVKMLRDLKGEEIGDYLEFGVFNGSSISSMYQVGKELGLKETRYFGFDAFKGLPEKSEYEDDGVWKKGFYACTFEQMKECLQRNNINPGKINWIKGWYENTLNNETARQYQLSNLGIAFIDCDTYSSSKSVLDFITPLLTSPAILCFDDWKLNDLDIKGMGEYQSFNEFLDKNPQFKIKEIKSYNRKSKSFLISPA